MGPVKKAEKNRGGGEGGGGAQRKSDKTKKLPTPNDQGNDDSQGKAGEDGKCQVKEECNKTGNPGRGVAKTKTGRKRNRKKKGLSISRPEGGRTRGGGTKSRQTATDPVTKKCNRFKDLGGGGGKTRRGEPPWHLPLKKKASFLKQGGGVDHGEPVRKAKGKESARGGSASRGKPV